jgi:SAM-dependent MidA family methyltransferase
MTAEKEIRHRIMDRGAITFAEFMHLALYWPGGGYYRGPGDPIGGPHGDFYTSPLVHPAFGALLSVQLFQMWQLMDRPSPFTVLELGAGNGLLCRDVVKYSTNLPEGFPQDLGYICLDVDSLPGLETESAATEGRPPVVRVAADWHDWGTLAPPAGIPVGKFRGCVLSNELLDAFPVHQVIRKGGKLLEVYVALNQGELAIVHDGPSTPKLEERLDGLGLALAEGQTAEICLGLADWAESVSNVLKDGFVLTVDYGREAKDLYSNADRPRGTLTTFYRHIQTDAPLRRIGGQDITAQVDFTSVVNEGRNVGLLPVGHSTQREFLLNLGLQQWQRGLTRLGLLQHQTGANRAGMVDLVRPGGLGDFKVLVQGKGVASPALWGFQTSGQHEELKDLMDSVPAPLMTPEHLDLNQARNPGTEFQIEDYWPPFAAMDRNEEV